MLRLTTARHCGTTKWRCLFSLQGERIFFVVSCFIVMSRDRSVRVFVGRLPGGARERDVERFFHGFGRIKEINLKNGFGFVVSG